MDFRKNQAIYLQLADFICDGILEGQWKAGDRLPSVRDLAVEAEVNPNTIMRTVAMLQDQGIIKNQRGIGYFVAQDAKPRIMETKKRNFIENELRDVFRTIELLGIDMKEIAALYEDYRAGKEVAK